MRKKINAEIINKVCELYDKGLTKIEILEIVEISMISLYRILSKNNRTKKIGIARKISETDVEKSEDFTKEQWDKIIKIRALIRTGNYWNEFPVEEIFSDQLIQTLLHHE